jgi:rhomboid protease GluP
MGAVDWKRLFDSVGLNGTQWQWRIIRWEQRLERWRAGLWRRKTHVTYRHKFCHCGALVDQDTVICPRCGERAPSWRGQVAQRAFRVVVPGRYPAAILLIVANVGLFAAEWLGLTPRMADRAAFIPILFVQGEYWRLITYAYLHANLMHIAFNMLALSQLGFLLEEEIGWARFLAAYTLTALAGAFMDLVMGIPVVGASGAIFGLIGFGLSYAHFTGGSRGAAMRGFFLQWALYGFLFGALVPRVDNYCHAGGFVLGLVLGFLVERERIHAERLARVWRALAWLLIAMTLAAFGWMAVR